MAWAVIATLQKRSTSRKTHPREDRSEKKTAAADAVPASRSFPIDAPRRATLRGLARPSRASRGPSVSIPSAAARFPPLRRSDSYAPCFDQQSSRDETKKRERAPTTEWGVS